MVSVYAAYVKRLATAVDQVRFYERNKETFGSFLANVPVTEDAILYCGNDFRDRHCATDSSARLLRKFLVHPIHHPMRLFSRLTVCATARSRTITITITPRKWREIHMY